MKLETIKKYRDKILEVAAKNGAYDIRVFGSVAKGETRVKSDVDFLVKMEAGRSLLDLSGLCIDLEDLIGCKVDVVTEGGVSPYLRERIFTEAVPL